MPALYALGQHPALEEVQRTLQEGEALFAYLDDVYAVCSPARARPILDALTMALGTHCGIGVHMGKTRVWNRGGVEPPGFQGMGTPEQPGMDWRSRIGAAQKRFENPGYAPWVTRVCGSAHAWPTRGTRHPA